MDIRSLTIKGDAMDIASRKPGGSKLLSIILTGRDDDYMLDFKYRITTTINYIARNLHQLWRLDDVEILVADWGSRTPMAQTLALSPEAGSICRFLYVPPAVVRAVQSGEETFHISYATNAGLRRAQGEYFLIFGADTLIPEHALESILALLGGRAPAGVTVDRTYFLLSRYHVPWHFVRRQPTMAEWDRYLVLHAGEYGRENSAIFSVSSGAGALMMHRSLWHELRGLDEVFGRHGMCDVDLGLRVAQRYPWIELSYLGVSLFHMQHPLDDRGAIAQPNTNSPMYNSKIQANDENWGLGGYDLKIQCAENIEGMLEPADSQESFQKPGYGDVVNWEHSRREVLAQMTGDEVREDVRRIAEIAGRSGWTRDPQELDSLFFLSWFGRYHYPRIYLEFGISRGYAAAVVADACPGVEIYGIDRWDGEIYRGAPIAIARRLLRECLAHTGYVRFINGDVSTAVQRLQDSFVGPIFFDLVLVRGDLLPADAVKQVKELLPCLSGGGGLVFTHESADQFMTVWNEIRAGYPQYTYFRCENRGAGLILKASLRGGDRDGSEEACRFATGCVGFTVAKWRFVRLFDALMRPHRYRQYSIRMLEWAKRKGRFSAPN
jgi:predicted O-methyltransferase YrrM